MSIKNVNLNIINAKEKYIIVCIDCNGNLNYKSANMFYKKYPDLFYKFRQYTSKTTNVESLLGTVVFHEIENDRKIYGLVSECDYENNELKYFDYKAFFKSLLTVLFEINTDSDIAISYKVGCVGTTAIWNNIYEIIEEFSKYFAHDIIIYKDEKEVLNNAELVL